MIGVFLLSLMITRPTLAASDPSSRDSFYRQLADLVSRDDYSKYFDKMELQVGSDVLTVDGETQTLTAAPEITNGRTMLPIRAVAEAAGAEVGWEPSTSTVLIESASGDEISCSIGSPTITVNESTSQMDVTPYIKQDKTYVPVRAVSEALELEVDWDATTQTVRLTAPYQTARLIVLADQLDTRGLDAETVISDGDGMWVLQFASPTRAREAAEALDARGIVVEPDRCIPLIRDEVVTGVTASGTHYSWGVADCGFDNFISKYAGQFVGKGVVAVVDSGVDFNHPFLRGRLLNSGYDFIDKDSTPNDGFSHGTHVAGIIIDCVGSAPVSILPIRVFDNQGKRGYDITIAAGIKYAADHGADVINLSLGGSESIVIDSAVSYAIERGCLVVIAAGNDDIDTVSVCPAHITEAGAVVVSAGDSNHNKAYFREGGSNHGSSVDLMAPGVLVKSTIPGGGFETMSGTSMAAPHAAAAAMLIDLAWGKTLTPAALEKELYSATTYGKWTNSTMGAGFLNLNRANVPSKVTPGISLNRSSLSLNVGENQTLTASVTPSGTAVSWSSSNTGVATVSGGKITAVGQGTATITAQIAYNGATYQAKCTVTVAADVKPEISLNRSSLSLNVGESQTLIASVTPNVAAVNWSSSNTSVATVSGGKVTAVAQGSTTITAQIVYNGTTYQAKCTVMVAAEVKPGISLNRSSLSLSVGGSQTLTASVTPSGTAVSWSSSNTGVATVSDGKVTAVAPGSASITAQIAYGGKFYTASCSISVTGEASEWTTVKPPEKDGYIVETKSQYRFRTKETTSSTQSNLPGWVLYDTSTSYTWGAWSEWKDGGIFNYGDSIQVETRQMTGTSTTYYNLYYYKYWNSAAGAYYYTYSSGMGGTKYTATAKASDCVPYQSFDGHQAYTYNGFSLWWVESTTVKTTNSGQQYRTRDRIETKEYHYYRWSDWSSWSDLVHTPSDNRDVETRTLYRYVPRPV